MPAQNVIDTDGLRCAFDGLYDFIDYAEEKYGKSEEFTLARQKLEAGQMWLNRAVSEALSQPDYNKTEV